MSFSRVKPASWAIGERLTSTQMNSLDTNVSNAIDKRAASYDIDSVSITRTSPFVGVGDATVWTSSSGQTFTIALSGNGLHIPFEPPEGCTLTSVSLWLKPASGHGGEPDTLPSMDVRYWDISGSGGTPVTILGSITDTYGSAGTYEAAHALTVSGLSHTIAKTVRRYSVVFIGEAGANGLTGLAVRGIQWTATVTKLDVG